MGPIFNKIGEVPNARTPSELGIDEHASFPLPRVDLMRRKVAAQGRIGRPRVLLAEDDDNLRSLMRAFLRAEGYNVLACRDGQRALQAYLDDPDEIDLLISDLEMPYLTGSCLASVISAHHRSLPIILMSGSDLTNEMLKTFKAAGWLFIQKPFPVPEMLSAIHQRLGHLERNRSAHRKTA